MGSEFETLLDRFISERADHEIAGYRARLMLGGAATDEVAFIEMMEEIGGLVVTDALCYGSRAFWNRTIKKESDPYRVLADLYLNNLPCPRMFDEFETRSKFMFDAVERASVDGVVLVHNKF